MTIRSFLAIPLNSATVRRLADQADALYDWDAQGRIGWPDSSSYHLTLCFLGEIELDQVAQLESRLRELVQQQGTFAIRLGAIGYLQVNPGLGVVAALADPQEALLALQQQVAEQVAEAGIRLKDADFYPHVTLGRLSPNQLLATDDPLRTLRIELDQLVVADSVVLYQSLPSQNGSIYSPLFEAELACDGDVSVR